jgi:hypothetical protein
MSDDGQNLLISVNQSVTTISKSFIFHLLEIPIAAQIFIEFAACITIEINEADIVLRSVYKLNSWIITMVNFRNRDIEYDIFVDRYNITSYS